MTQEGDFALPSWIENDIKEAKESTENDLSKIQLMPGYSHKMVNFHKELQRFVSEDLIGHTFTNNFTVDKQISITYQVKDLERVKEWSNDKVLRKIEIILSASMMYLQGVQYNITMPVCGEGSVYFNLMCCNLSQC